MSTQEVLNVVGAILIAGAGWWLNNMWVMVKSLQEQLSAIHVKLVEQYPPRAEMQNVFNRIFEKLDEIQRELSQK
jgi:hypothetical protein